MTDTGPSPPGGWDFLLPLEESVPHPSPAQRGRVRTGEGFVWESCPSESISLKGGHQRYGVEFGVL